MGKIKLLIFALFLLFNSSYATAVGFLSPPPIDKKCWFTFKNPLSPNKSIYSALPQITDSKTPLHKETKARILSQPKVKELKDLYKEGQDLVFDFAYLGQEISHKGEHIQRDFLIKIIKFLFPKSNVLIRNYENRFKLYPQPDVPSEVYAVQEELKFETEGFFEKYLSSVRIRNYEDRFKSYLQKPNKTYVPLEVYDIQEELRFENEGIFERYLSNHKKIVDMVLLKMANSSQKKISKEYKKAFPTFEKNTVLSLYLPESYLNYFTTSRNHSYLEEETEETIDLFQILDEFLSIGFRKVFLTSHFNAHLKPETKAEFLSLLSDRFDKVLFLSQVSTKELFQIQEQDKVIFFNDLVGYTPVLHSIADVAFILGPINMLEGIFLDAKVIFMNEKDSLPSGRKYQMAFSQLKQVALKTNRAVYINYLEEAEEALQSLEQLSLKPVVYPDEVILNPSKGSALDQLLDRLHFQITENAPFRSQFIR